MRDMELDQILFPLQSRSTPSEMQIERWQHAVQAELTRHRLARKNIRWKSLAQVAAGWAVGFIVGTYAPFEKSEQKIYSPPATIETIYANTQ